MTPGELRALAVRLFREGRLDSCRDACLAHLRFEPFDRATHRLLGVALHNLGDNANTGLQMCRLLLLDPADVWAFTMLGAVLQARSQPRDALRAFQIAEAIAPADALWPAWAARLLTTLGRDDEAVALARRSIAFDPAGGEGFGALAAVHEAAGRLRASAEAFRRAVHPSDAGGWNVLAIKLQRAGELDQAVTAYMRSLVLDPGQRDALGNLAAALYQQNRLEGAERAFSMAIAMQPDNALVFNNYGLLLGRRAKPGAAIRAYHRAIALAPDAHEAFSNLGQAHIVMGEAERAFRMSSIAIALRPRDGTMLGNRLMHLNYVDVAPAEVFAHHRQWAALHADPLAPTVAPRGDWAGGRRLRVGYVSADFWWHSVAYFVEPLLEAHDRDRFEIFCYSDARQRDVVSERLATKAEHWRVIVGQSDVEVARRIREDGIDVLVDMGGHTADNRLLAFARRPAPVQVSWLGYPHSTGMRAMTHRLSDAIADPAPEADAWSSETIVRLPGGFHCYRPFTELAETTPPPRFREGPNDPITFGSFNNLAKVGPRTVAVWAAVLRAVPGSRLLLKSRPLGDALVAERFAGLFAAHGVAGDRLLLVPYIQDQGGHMRAYERIDVALDPFPYNGTTTTCEALWMGVPVVTLLGRSHAGRVGASLLSQVGLVSLIARDEADYVTLAAALATDPARLDALRGGLRGRLRESSLGDAAFFARKLEAAYVEMATLAR
ncbi:MAG: tetratricopeptide repeat protein [Alphaproteobacteria bacterium]|nr:tetratricopeptide repeat protein [Alphaproteobacteria bacterium]